MRVCLAVGVCGLLGLAGCAGGALSGVDQTAGSPASGGVAGAKLTGKVHGGQQPIAGAQIYLFAANTTGYGGNGIAASSANASVSLLSSAANATLDMSGGATNGDYYVTADSGGNFSISGDYTCAPGAQVYLYALGGNPGAGTNPAAGLMAALGNCPTAGNFASATPFIVVNEISTVAAAYAFAGFATDATHVSSSGTALAQVGIANAFANAGNLETLSTGESLSVTPSGGLIYYQEIVNAVADMLAACVNTTGAESGPTSPTPCYTLFNNAMSGGSTGILPSETASAAINIAHNPCSNAAALDALVTADAPFEGTPPVGGFEYPSLSVGIGLRGGYFPNGIAIDGFGNVWIANTGYTGDTGVIEFSSSGAVLSPQPGGFTAGGISIPVGIAIDASNDVWVTNNGGGNNIAELSNTGVPLSGANGYTGGGLDGPASIAIDGSGNAWVTNYSGNSVTELSNTGSILSGANGYTGGGLNGPSGIAIDGSGNAWVVNASGNSVTKLSSSGLPLSGANGYMGGGGLNGPTGSIAIDGYGDVWLVDEVDYMSSSNSLTELSSSGAILSTTALYYGTGVAVDSAGYPWVSSLALMGGNFGPYFIGYVSEYSRTGSLISSTYSPVAGYGVAIDGSGNVWMLAQNGVVEYVGAAAPVVTPTSLAVKNNALGARP